ncbi:hypothetical protein EXS61_00365 [Candidatus Parcubacteria bacterium]|nr:hypothetical protein [Candidatus Parcubacteria bacterium]
MIKVSSILIGVADLNKSKSFYEEIFGMTFDEFRPPFASAKLDDVEFNIEENADYRSKDWASNYIGGRKQVSFQVDNLEQFLQKVSDFGAKIVQQIETKPWGWKEAIIADIDGNEFIIEQEI